MSRRSTARSEDLRRAFGNLEPEDAPSNTFFSVNDEDIKKAEPFRKDPENCVYAQCLKRARFLLII